MVADAVLLQPALQVELAHRPDVERARVGALLHQLQRQRHHVVVDRQRTPHLLQCSGSSSSSSACNCPASAKVCGLSSGRVTFS
ncbi:hypothetical protein [Kitasatospora sp. NBC_00315]|uniref:hypothetical protein n=1 Tax=Kitasatospora sp. NBC_00315 TaxID=2975963 RepID=UPI0032522F39